MSKGNGKKKNKSRPAKAGKPLHRRKEVQEQNKKLADFFSHKADALLAEMNALERRVAESNQQLWKNQQRQNEGLGVAEEHVVLLRRVLNDAVGGITRVTTISRRKEGSDEAEDAQVINWGWYGEQLHFSDDPQTFVNGVVLTAEELHDRKLMELAKRRHDVVLYLAGCAADDNEEELRRIYDEGDLDAHLQKFLPKEVVWEAGMSQISAEVVETVLQQREAARRQREKMEAAKERGRALQAAKENDPEEVEAAKEQLLEETKQFGEDAAHVIALIEAGKDDEARVAMAELEKQVHQAEADARGASGVPEGAAIFGG